MSIVTRRSVFGVILIMGLFLFCMQHVYSADKNLVAYWSFDEASGDVAADKSGNKLDGLNNGAIFEKGKVGNCLNFDGQGASVEVEHNAKLSFENDTPLSFSFWVKLADLAPAGAHDFIDKIDFMGANVQLGYRVGQNWQGSTIFFQLANERLPGANYLCVSTANDIGEGWHHIAITYKGDKNAENINMYVDGLLVAKNVEANALTGTIQNEMPLKIGQAGDAPNYFPGSLDEVKIYNKVLTADEVKADAGLKVEKKQTEKK